MNLAGRMPLETEYRLVRGHTAAIVYDLYHSTSRILDANRNLRGKRIKGILHKLLNHRGRPLYHLPGSYHIRYIGW